MKRVTALLAAVLVGLFAATAPAVAVSTAAPAAVIAAVDDCEPSQAGDEYVPDEPCQISVEASAVCRGDVPYLAWEATVEGTDATNLTVTFNNPSGTNAVYSGLPLAGELLWPGAVLDDSGEIVDWPGWTEVDGDWIVGDQWDWVRPSVDVTFSVNPETTFSIAYPLPNTACAGPADRGGEDEERPDSDDNDSDSDGGGGTDDELGLTGYQGGALLGAAGLLLGAGVVLVMMRRRAQH